MFCPMSCQSCFAENIALEEYQNLANWSKAANANPKRFLARKIRKLKKLLKFGSKSLAKKRSLEERQNNENEIEQRQNCANEALERKLAAQCLEEEQNMMNENWENWDSCYLCAGQQHPFCCPSYPLEYLSPQHSICYVFMPGQPEPVPVKLRNAKIPGGVMWISYQPDLDIRAGDNLHAYPSQIPQGQRAILV